MYKTIVVENPLKEKKLFYGLAAGIQNGVHNQLYKNIKSGQ